MKRMMLLLCTLLPVAGGAYGQDLPDGKKLVDLRGQISTTLITNHTPDTLKINTRAFYYTPYYETNAGLTIPPGKTDSGKVSLAYPDFIFLLNYDLRLYNAPGRRIHAHINSIKNGSTQVSFTGDLVQENDYYMAYQINFKGLAKETRLYYTEAAKLQDLNTFPAVADSINDLALGFLKKYAGPLPSYFKSSEELRLNYNAAFRKYNVLLEREFKSGKKNLVRASYFDFEKSVPLNPANFVLSTSYIDYARNLMFFRSGQSPSVSTAIALVDSLVKPSEPGDALKMNMLSTLFKQSKPQFNVIFPKLAFYDVRNKYAADSIITLKNRLPLVGMPSPRIKLANTKGDTISLTDFKGKPVILNFWASWCAPCLEALPYENSLYDKYSAKGLAIVNICVETDRKKWESLSREKNLHMTNLYATADEYRRLKMLYNIDALPRSILIAKDGSVLNNYYKWAGLIKDEEIEELLLPTGKD